MQKSDKQLAEAFTVGLLPDHEGDINAAAATQLTAEVQEAIPLTEAEQRLQYLLTHPPETRDEFLTFIEEVLGREFKTGLVMALEAVEEGSEPPLDWMWEAWCLGWGRSSDGQWRKLSGKEQGLNRAALLLHGPRGGMKTLAIAALWFSICWFIPGYTVTHTATQKHQAQQCVGYLHGWANSATFMMRMHKPQLKVVNFHNGSSLAVLTASLDGLNAPHTLSISIDEVETLDPSLLGQALQIQQEQPGFGFPSLVILASTQKRAGLGMSKLIKEAIKTGCYRYIMWNCWDVCEACPDWRREDVESKRVFCKDWSELAELCARLDLKAETEPLRPIEREQLALATNKMSLLKSNCPLAPDCCGKAIRGSGHLAINTLIFRIQNLDRATWEAENLCKRPSVEGAVYYMLSHENINEDAIYREDGRVVAGVDYGFVDKSIIVLGCEHRIFCDLFWEFEGDNYFEEDLVARAKELQAKYKVSKWIVGNDAIKLVRMMRKAGLNAIRSSRKSKLGGCDHVARLICDGTGVRRLRFHPVGAYALYEQMEGYLRKKNSVEPKDGDDDYCDALRYLCEDVKIHTGQGTRILTVPSPVGRSMGQNVVIRRPGTGEMKLRRL